MMSWFDIKSLEKSKKDLQLRLDEFLNSNNREIYNINELKIEVLALDKYLEKLLCKNDTELKQIIDSNTKTAKSFRELKDKYKKVSKLKNSIAKMIGIIELYQNQDEQSIKKIL